MQRMNVLKSHGNTGRTEESTPRIPSNEKAKTTIKSTISILCRKFLPFYHIKSRRIYYTSFFGSLQYFEFISLVFLIILILLRILFHVLGNHFGRSGRNTEYCLVFTILFSFKNSPIATLFQYNWEKMMILHKVFAFVTIFGGSIHGFPMLFSHTISEVMHDTQLLSGIILLIILSLQPIVYYLLKHQLFKYFKTIHILNYLTIVYLAFIHEAELVPLIAVFWVIDIFIRYILTSTHVQIEVTKSQCHQFVKLTYTLPITFTPGQYAFILIPDVSSFESHPFSYMSIPNVSNRTVSHVIKASGVWTNALHNISSTTGFVEGPYGGIPFKLESYSVVLLISGGIGVTPNLAAFKYLQNKSKSDGVTLKKVYFVWAIKEKDLSLVDFVELPSLIRVEDTEEGGGTDSQDSAFEVELYVSQPRVAIGDASNDAVTVGALTKHYRRLDVHASLQRAVSFAESHVIALFESMDTCVYSPLFMFVLYRMCARLLLLSVVRRH